MSKHLVLIHRYFAPDTPPYASILEAIARQIGSPDMRVTVLTCQPSYNRSVVSRVARREQLTPAVAVTRFRVLDDRSSDLLKIINLVWFCLRVGLAFPRIGKVDVVMAATTPPVVVAAVACRLARTKNARFVYHKQDIYPEVAVALGGRSGLLATAARKIDSATDRRAARVVVLSGDMERTVMNRAVPRDRVEVINNFDPWAADSGPTIRAAAGSRTTVTEGRLEVAFAGNLGRFQGLETIFEAVDRLTDEQVRWHFFGHGALSGRVSALAARHGEAKVVAHGYRDPLEVADFLSAKADLGVVSLAPGVIRAAYPSKTMSYLRRGVPILAMVEADSELGRTVASSRIGVQVEPGAVSALVACLGGLARDRSPLDGAGDRARALYERELGASVRLAQWARLFEEIS